MKTPKDTSATTEDIYEMFDAVLSATETDCLEDAIKVAESNKEDLIDLLRDPRMGTGYDITWELLVDLVNQFVSHQTASPFA